MTSKDYRVGDVIQISETYRQEVWRCALVIVTEVKGWGIQGFVPTVTGKAYIRLSYDDILLVGHSFYPDFAN